jgi:hypothetical protein
MIHSSIFFKGFTDSYRKLFDKYVFLYISIVYVVKNKRIYSMFLLNSRKPNRFSNNLPQEHSNTIIANT